MHQFSHLAGSIIFVGTLLSRAGGDDALVVALAGEARLVALSISKQGSLVTDSLVDLSPLQDDHLHGASADHDMVVAQLESRPGTAVVAASLGQGAAVVVLEWRLSSTGSWCCREPYALPLRALAQRTVQGQQQQQPQQQSSFTTGMGEITDLAFLSGYLEPVLLLLHTGSHPRTYPGRLGREEGGAPPLYVTAVSVSVAHQRSAVLWSRPVNADADRLYGYSKTKCLVVGYNSLTFLHDEGAIHQVLAVNGLAHTTCCQALMPLLNANPLLKLSIQLDGSSLAWLSSHSALLSLRNGPLYVLQRVAGTWTLLPLGRTLGPVGEVTHLSCLPMTCGGTDKLTEIVKEKDAVDVGVLFAGSRLGDSVLLGYTLERLNAEPMVAKKASSVVVKQEMSAAASSLPEDASVYDRLLASEEEALYAPTTNGDKIDIVPASDEESDLPRHKRSKTTKVTMVRSLVALDTLPNLGPLGASCQGPIAKPPRFLQEREDSLGTPGVGSLVMGAPAHIFPCGFGSSGGLALATLPGRDDRMLLAEEDFRNIETVYGLSLSCLVLLRMTDKSGEGTRVLRVGASADGDFDMSEVDLDSWCESSDGDDSIFPNARELLKARCLAACELSVGLVAMVVAIPEVDVPAHCLAVLEAGKSAKIVYQTLLENEGEAWIQYISPAVSCDEAEGVRALGCLWSNGKASTLLVSREGLVSRLEIEKPELHVQESMEVDDEEDAAIRQHYQSLDVVSIDVFTAPASLFSRRIKQMSLVKAPTSPKPATPVANKPSVDWAKMKVAQLKEELGARGLSLAGKKADLVARLEEDDENQVNGELTPAADEKPSMPPAASDIVASNHPDYDEIDIELYGAEPSIGFTEERSDNNGSEMNVPTAKATFVAVCRKSGRMSVYRIDASEKALKECFATLGCGHGFSLLEDDSDAENLQPRSHKTHVREMRFFASGDDASPAAKPSQDTRKLLLALVTSDGDFQLYRCAPGQGQTELQLVSTEMVTRKSQEQGRHRTKMARRGVVAKDRHDDMPFRYVSLHRFHGVSGHSGLFAMLPRPFWIVSERGHPVPIYHRFRHAAPAGGKDTPIAGFCCGVLNAPSGTGGFLTVHERVGRVGSQRISVFQGLSPLFATTGCATGSGYYLEKVPLGVTVRHIHFLDDPSISTGARPLYALLVSQESELDHRDLNDDGLTVEERERIREDKEKARVAKQVEADLGGYDFENEWVEEIEREDCFGVDTGIGGAPPIKHESYAIWIVDAANNWQVVDSFDLQDGEYGLDLTTMSLTEFLGEAGSPGEDDDDQPEVFFIVVGTGIVDKDGEDVASRGRALLLDIKVGTGPKGPTGPVNLSLAFEKEIFHGPVTTVSCLDTEGRKRLIIGAGSDVNLEQWGKEKLTQVGFYRATMQIQAISIFKTFLLLTDAYDTVHFLIYRESDKSLTLLAKDYDPVSVYAAGLIGRGAAMSIACQDDRQNLQFFQYAPGEAAARGGNRLVCRGDFHLGTQTTSFSPHFCVSSLVAHSATPSSTVSALKQQSPFFGKGDDEQRIGLFFGTTDGTINSIIPMSEPVYWRLTALQAVLANALENDGGLNPRAWRLYRRSPKRGGCRTHERKKGVVDGDLITRFVDLPLVEQEDIASAIGSTVALIMDNILELQCSSALA